MRFRSGAPRAALLGLRSIEHLYLDLGRRDGLPLDAGGPAALRDWAATLAWADAAERWRPGSADRPTPFRASVERRGEHSARSPDYERALGAALRSTLAWPVDLRGFEARVHALVVGSRAWVGISLHTGDLSRARRGPGAEALKPCVANALARLALRAAPPAQGRRVVLDPLCGFGSIPLEAKALDPDALCLAGDRDAERLRLAAKRFRDARAPVRCLRWDARRLPLPEASVDAVVADLPFGRRVGSHRANRRLYPAFVASVQRVLRPGGVAVLLTSERKLMDGLLAQAEVLERVRFDLSGLAPIAYVVRVRPAQDPSVGRESPSPAE